jgi:hypothetical protein
MLGQLTMEAFKVGDTLTVDVGGDSSYILTLEKVTPSRYRGLKGHRDPFSLLFSGARTFFLAQGTHPVSLERIGNFELFLVPVVPITDDLFYYEACFN